jgi:rhodanese-related sulfurtransferase
MSFTVVEAAQAKQMQDEGAVLIDVREPDEVAACAIAGAVNVPLSAFSVEQVKEAAGERKIVVLCLGGMRSEKACCTLPAEMGAYMLKGGIKAWMAAGFPVV